MRPFKTPQPQSFARLKFSIRHFQGPENRKQLVIRYHHICLSMRLVLFDLKVLFSYFIIDLLVFFSLFVLGTKPKVYL